MITSGVAAFISLITPSRSPTQFSVAAAPANTSFGYSSLSSCVNSSTAPCVSPIIKTDLRLRSTRFKNSSEKSFSSVSRIRCIVSTPAACRMPFSPITARSREEITSFNTGSDSDSVSICMETISITFNMLLSYQASTRMIASRTV